MRTDARIEQDHRQIVFHAFKVDRDGVLEPVVDDAMAGRAPAPAW